MIFLPARQGFRWTLMGDHLPACKRRLADASSFNFSSLTLG
jgi:hypothetical protein